MYTKFPCNGDNYKLWFIHVSNYFLTLFLSFGSENKAICFIFFLHTFTDLYYSVWLYYGITNMQTAQHEFLSQYAL